MIVMEGSSLAPAYWFRQASQRPMMTSLDAEIGGSIGPGDNYRIDKSFFMKYQVDPAGFPRNSPKTS